MNQKSHNNLLKSLLLISKIRFSDIDEISKFAKSEAGHKRKLKKIKNLYDQNTENEKDNLENLKGNWDEIFPDFDKIFPPDDLNDIENGLTPESFLFDMTDEHYKKLADMIGEAMDELDKQNIQSESIENFMNNEDFKVFKKDPSFEDLVDWFKLLLLANNGELQLTVTPGKELVIIFKNFVNPNGNTNESTPIEQPQKRKRKPRNKKGPSSEQDNE